MADALTVPCPDCQAPAGTPCYGHLDRPHGDRERVADLRALEHGTCALCGQPMVRGSVEDAPVDAWHHLPEDAAACPRFPDPHQDWNGYATMINLGLSPGHPGVEHFVPAGETTDATPETADLTEEGRRLASEREDLIAAGVPSSLLGVPLAPDLPTVQETLDQDRARRTAPREAWDAQREDASQQAHEAVVREALERETDSAGVPLADDPPGTWDRSDYEGGDPSTGPLPVCPECRAGKHPNCDGTAWDPDADAPTSCRCPHGSHRG